MKNFLKKSWVNYLVLFAVSSMFIGCAATEKSLKKELKEDPNNISAHEQLAEMYYKKYDFENAYKHYKKLEELNAIKDSQKYSMYISGTRTQIATEDNWDKIYPLRNTKIIRYKTTHHNPVLSFILPEHWLLIAREAKPTRPVIQALDFSCDFPVPLECRLLKKRIPEFTPDEGLIYCGKGFIMEYELDIPQKNYNVTPVSQPMYRMFDLEKELQGLMKELKVKEWTKYIENPEAYICNKFTRKGQINEQVELRKAKLTPGTQLENQKLLMGYITYTEIRTEDTIDKLQSQMKQVLDRIKKTSKTEPGIKLEDDQTDRKKNEKGKKNEKRRVRRFILYVTDQPGDALMVINTFFNEKYEQTYLKEIDDFLLRNIDLPDELFELANPQ